MKKMQNLINQFINSGLIYKELIQGLRSRSLFYSIILLSIACLYPIYQISTSSSTDLEYTKTFHFMFGVIYFHFCWLLMLWNSWLTLREYANGNYAILDLTGYRPHVILKYKCLTYLILCFIGYIIIYPSYFFCQVLAIKNIPQGIYYLLGIPFIILPFYIFTLQNIFQPNKYMRYPLAILCACLPVGCFWPCLYATMILTSYSGLDVMLSVEAPPLLAPFMKQSIYAVGLYLLILLELTYIASQSMSDYMDSFHFEIKSIGLLIFITILYGFYYLIEQANGLPELSHLVSFLFFVLLLGTYAPSQMIPRFTEIRSKRNQLTQILYNYLGPGRQTNLRYALILMIILLCAGTTRLADIAAYDPRFIRVLIYPLYITGIFRLFSPDSKILRFSKLVKTAIFIMVLIIEELIIPLKIIQQIPIEIQRCLFYLPAIAGFIFLINDHTGHSQRFRSDKGKLKQLLLQKINR